MRREEAEKKESERQKARVVVEAKKEKAKELKEKDRSCSRQRDIVQIAESGDIDHRGAAAAEPPGTDTSDLTVPLQPLLPSPSVAASVSRLHRLPTRPAGNRITRWSIQTIPSLSAFRGRAASAHRLTAEFFKCTERPDALLRFFPRLVQFR